MTGYADGYDASTRGYRSGRVAGRNTATPKFMEEICISTEEPTCDPTYMFRTVMGECNNLG